MNSVAGDEGIAVSRIVVIDDHATFADLLSGALNREVDLRCIGTANTLEAGVALCIKDEPDLVVIDYRLPDGDGLQGAERILRALPSMRIVMLTGDPTSQAMQRAASLGVCGFLPKDGALSILLDVLRTVRQGEFIVGPALISELLKPRQLEVSMNPGLTARELEVLQLMSQGFDVTANARTLAISAHTCRGYVKSILSKLDAHSQLEAVATANRLGLVGAVGQ
ncbi:response regulator [Paeniglutamicibacter kerguelensis]|uniref:DNA-binding NarL/FixJ family response regulator n=1 Tax=Paeniglutamicibacter kerguelensis TaxID=254788 RepID=A0ABS4XB97_9MICC|nr:response regulator transcription factor [Paeniglutamicibacter kerguelensis]MBP2385740.1 DNA-binding NarL/FixJ family response regulator [Paeniglutamicibacter kerguelensis]